MNKAGIIAHRLINQQIAGTVFKTPQQIVGWLGAMQAQEYALSKWAIGLRLPGSTDASVEKAFNEGKILRTHLLRPTWHFVCPEDIRWMLKLTAPRIHIANGFMCRKLGLDDKLLKKAATVFAKTLKDGNYMTRNALNEELKKNKIDCEGHHLSHIMMYAELEGIVCSGPRQGKQFTYALLEERAGKGKELNREESITELTKRYFKSRGPATIKDFTTWSGLTVKDAKAGIHALDKHFIREMIGGLEYIFPEPEAKKQAGGLSTFLMPDYDEYGMGYKDRSAIFNDARYKSHVSRGNPVFNRMIIIDGVIEGTWQRTLKQDRPVVETFPFGKLSAAKEKKMKQAVQRYLKFTGS